MIRKGHHNGSSYWYCKTCNRYSSGRKKPSQEAIFNRYSQGTFTIKELSQEFNISASTVKRILRNYTVTKERWDDFLKEKPYEENGVNFHYTHRKLRAAYRSLKEHLDLLFTYQDFPMGVMPNTNNAVESFNSWLKRKLQLHPGLSPARRETLISNLIMAYNPRSRKET